MPKRIAIVTGDFHKQLADEMIAFATAEIEAGNAEVSHIVTVAGSYEVPLIMNELLARPGVDGAVALGYIEKGETLHGEVMGQIVHRALVELQLTYKKPIGIGIIGPGATASQAEVRKEGAARGAVKAVLRSLSVLKQLADSPKNAQSAGQ